MSDFGSWPRPYYAPGGGDAYVSVAVYGRFGDIPDVPPAKYRSAGLPDGVLAFRESRGGEMYSKLSPLMEFGRRRKRKAPDVANRSPEAVFLSGGVSDPGTLDYLRDVVGFVAYLLDHGGVIAFDTPTVTFWSQNEWHARFFTPRAPVPARHVEVIAIPETGGLSMIRTMGLAKFGRLDLCVRARGRFESAVKALLEHQAEFLAFGGTLRKGERITAANLPSAGRVRYIDDPYGGEPGAQLVELAWPKGTLDRPWWRFW